MRTAQSFVGLAIAVAAASATAIGSEDVVFTMLLKRQAPGTPAYNCHDNCGQAIIQARNSDDVCNDEIFLTDYANCLQCSGPDNEDIWKYYGTTLSASASTCGLSTTPLSGDQPDVGAAIAAGSSTSSTAAATSSATAAPETTSTSAAEATSTTEAVETTSTEAAETTSTAAAETTTEAASSAASSATVATSAVVSSSVTVALGTGTGVPTATATTSGLVQVTNAANSNSGKAFGVAGAMAFGAVFFGL
ncbi:hypothetical protein NKR23_g10961 [Pleurostoma richardsiae]|uniref:Dynactin arp1 p25 subunit protein n=1 Tax=Pleurostoma richardsiae TaxID=41990 RepID=A0AA38VBM6_9PEZI|nr:hypothetical protein NKR23_g10961 [Pleurostoma richardsiae]